MSLLDKFFGNKTDKDKESVDHDHDLRVATCAIMLEIANIDGEFSSDERTQIVSFLESHFGLSSEIAHQLIEKAKEELENSIDLWSFTNRINQNYNREEKIGIVEMIWKIIYSDDYMDKHEDYLVKKLGALLRLSHKDLMDAKMKAKGKA
jgi:uncharacterized tellurite resistance protein B-like protein